jgi:hypothetical protein
MHQFGTFGTIAMQTGGFPKIISFLLLLLAFDPGAAQQTLLVKLKQKPITLQKQNSQSTGLHKSIFTSSLFQ